MLNCFQLPVSFSLSLCLSATVCDSTVYWIRLKSTGRKSAVVTHVYEPLGNLPWVSESPPGITATQGLEKGGGVGFCVWVDKKMDDCECKIVRW